MAVAAVLAGAPSLGAQSGSTTRVTLTEGTNIALDVSPDGETLAFDLLGRIWLVSVGGGAARPLTDALGDARQPTWSPDGDRIAFQAYWDGNYHLWSVALDGTGLLQHTRGPYDHREPDWSPDGSTIAVSSDRGGGYDVWLVDVADGEVVRVTQEGGVRYAPAFSPDGARIAFVAERDGGAEIRVVEVRGSGASRGVVSADGSQVNAPAWTPDGDALIYNEIGAGRSRLMRVNRRGGLSTDVLSLDGQDVFPFRAAATSDGLYYTADGRILHRGWTDGDVSSVPFSASVELIRPSWERRSRDLSAPGPFDARGIVSPAVSPDGGRVAFAALGDLWVQTVGGRLDQVTSDSWIETDPAWSPSGMRIAFSSDRGGGLDLYVWDADTREIERITQGERATLPSWSPDGSRIAFVTSGYRNQVRVVDLADGSSRVLRGGLNGAGRPGWSGDGTSIVTSVHWPYSGRFREGVNRALVVPVLPPRAARTEFKGESGLATGWNRRWAAAGVPPGRDGSMGGVFRDGRREPQLQDGERFLELGPHGSVGTRGTDGPVWSPDGGRLAYVSEGVLWVARADSAGQMALGEPRRISQGVAEDPSWTGDSRSIVYLGASGLRRINLEDGSEVEIAVDLEWTRADPPEPLLLRAAALWDGYSAQLRRDVDVLIQGGMIAGLWERGAGPEMERMVVVDHGVVIPGLIEMHAHLGIAAGEQLGRTWLAFGVTSVRCPACDPYELREAREAGESGRRRSPRWFGTGPTIDGSRVYYPGAPALGSSAQVSRELARADALGYDLIKTYVRLADPVQARVVRDAHSLGIPVTSHELYPAVAFGADGVEHVRGTSRRGYSTKVSELYRSYEDVVKLLAASGMTLTPTLGIYGAFALLVQDAPSLLDAPRVDAFFPGAREGVGLPVIDPRERQSVEAMASLPRRVAEAGGRVVAGTDAPIIPPGLSYIAELEAMARYGGMRPLDVLRSATAEAGRALGYPGRLGVIEGGAYADLVVVGGNPVEDIQELRDVQMVIQGGVVHDVGSLLRPPH